jgi:hypothetical protein
MWLSAIVGREVVCCLLCCVFWGFDLFFVVLGLVCCSVCGRCVWGCGGVVEEDVGVVDEREGVGVVRCVWL